MPEELCQVSPKSHYGVLASHSDPSPFKNDLSHEMLDDVDGHGEDDGGVVLGGDGGEGLQVPGVALVNILLMVVFLRWHVNMVEITSITILMSMS